MEMPRIEKLRQVRIPIMRISQSQPWSVRYKLVKGTLEVAKFGDAGWIKD
jgi:hypothetical protein